MTIAEKILASHCGKRAVTPGEYVWAKVDETGWPGSPSVFKALERLGINKVFDPERIFIVDDHSSPPNSVASAEAVAETRRFVKKFGIKHWFEYGKHGIMHQVFPEHGFCVPGDLIAMTDSHSTAYGVFNVASCSINIEEVYVAIKGQLWFRVPETIKFWITGNLPRMCVGKDVILYIAGNYSTEVALYKAAEFLGPGTKTMSLASRWTIASMGPEIGAKFALFEADEKTFDFLKGRTERSYTPVKSDPDAVYEQEYEIDVTNLDPQVACPHDVGNVRSVAEVEGIEINQGFIGSCTNGRLEDLKMAANVLEGNKVHPDVRLIISPASMEVWKNALKAGLFEIFVEAGALVCHPTCGPCYGGQMGLLAAGERCISTTNRNFQGRMGSPQAEVYLANAATVAASTLAGKISDPRKYVS